MSKCMLGIVVVCVVTVAGVCFEMTGGPQLPGRLVAGDDIKTNVPVKVGEPGILDTLVAMKDEIAKRKEELNNAKMMMTRVEISHVAFDIDEIPAPAAKGGVSDHRAMMLGGLKMSRHKDGNGMVIADLRPDTRGRTHDWVILGMDEGGDQKGRRTQLAAIAIDFVKVYPSLDSGDRASSPQGKE